MASTYTDLGIEKMATGENAGTWGTKTNTNLDIIEKSIAGYVEQAVTSGGTTALSITDGDATESTSVARHAVIKLTGTITGNSIVTVPDSVEKVYIVTNGTSGAYTVQFKTASGTGITFGVSEKTTRLVYSDGTNLVDAGFGGASDMEGRELILDADADTSITADTDDQIDIKVGGTDRATITTGAIAPSSSDGISLGTSALEFSDLFLADGAVVNFGDDQDVSLTHVADTGLLLSSTDQLQFGDSGTYIHQSADGVLDLVADTEIEINATTIDINGAVAMDGAITGATNITLSGELDAATGDFSGDVDVDGTLEADAITLNGTSFIKIEGTNFTDSLLVGHATTGTLSSADDNTGVGIGALDALTSGDSNTALGQDAATALTTGSHNVFIGSTAGAAATDMQGCIGIGSSALGSADPGNNNIAIGESAGLNITGVRNLCIGENAGDNITSGSGNVVIGSAVDPSSATGNRQLLIAGNDGSTTTTWITGDSSGNLTFPADVAAASLDISGNVDIDGTLETDALSIASTTITTTAAEINLIDGGTSRGTTAVADGDGLLVNDDGTMRMTNVTTLKTYFTSGVSSAADDLTAGDSAVNLTTSSGNITIDAAANDSDIIFKGTDNSSDITMLTLDGSEAGAATFNNKVVATELDISGDADIDGTMEADAYTLGGASFIKLEGTNFADSIIVGHATTGTLSGASFNSALGLDSLKAITSGDKNTTIGYRNGQAITTGSANTSVGTDSFFTLSTGTGNTALGSNALKVVTGSRNIGIGLEAGDNISSGSGNVIIGEVDAGSATGDRQLLIAGNDGSTTTTWISGDSSGVVTLADDLLIKDGGTIGVASDADSITIASDGVVTFSQAPVFPDGSIAVADLDIDGATDIGEDLVDADLFIVDNGAGGTNRKVAASRIKTYVGGGTSWQAVKTGNFTASAGQGVFVNTTSAAITITLPAGTIGDEVSIVDYAGTFDSNACTVAANGSEKIFGSTNDLTVSTERAAFTLVFTDSTQGWLFKND